MPRANPYPFTDKYKIVDCGGEGDCGYSCITAGLGDDKTPNDDSNAARTLGSCPEYSP